MQFYTLKPIISTLLLLLGVSFSHGQSNFLSTGGFLIANDNNLSDPNSNSEIDETDRFLFSTMLKPSFSDIVPVELEQFDVEVISKREVMVRWGTSLEIENDFFEIEKSVDGNHWYSIGKLDGNGTKFEQSSYMFIDENPTTGRSFYRLKQVDFDQEYAFSNIAFVNIHGDDFQIFPNPTRDKIYLIVGNFSKDLCFQITDIIGNVQFKGVLIDFETEINVTHLIQGTYLIQIGAEGDHYRKPMVFVKTN